MIKTGDDVRFDVAFTKVIHRDYNRQVTLLDERGEPSSVFTDSGVFTTGGELPHGLKTVTLTTYVAEWERYVSFTSHMGFGLRVPGRDIDWVPYLL